jgi:hypothetical protein
MKSKDFDEKLDGGADVSEFLEMAGARRVNQELTRVELDLPRWMVRGMDEEAGRLGITRQALIKVWISERLEKQGIR